jgi:hypothetical protein
MSEWQPIETAPRDGSWFIICNVRDLPDLHYEIGRYDPYMHAEYTEVGDGLFRKEMRSSYDWSGFSNFGRATHWKPVGDPPKTESGE